MKLKLGSCLGSFWSSNCAKIHNNFDNLSLLICYLPTGVDDTEIKSNWGHVWGAVARQTVQKYTKSIILFLFRLATYVQVLMKLKLRSIRGHVWRALACQTVQKYTAILIIFLFRLATYVQVLMKLKLRAIGCHIWKLLLVKLCKNTQQFW